MIALADWLVIYAPLVWLALCALLGMGLVARYAWEQRRQPPIPRDEVYGHIYDFASEQTKRRGSR